MPVSWLLVSWKPGDCGPFSGQNFIYSILWDTIQSFPTVLNKILLVIFAVGIV
jgi:hypothetical protein